MRIVELEDHLASFYKKQLIRFSWALVFALGNWVLGALEIFYIMRFLCLCCVLCKCYLCALMLCFHLFKCRCFMVLRFVLFICMFWAPERGPETLPMS